MLTTFRSDVTRGRDIPILLATSHGRRGISWDGTLHRFIPRRRSSRHLLSSQCALASEEMEPRHDMV